jgi:holo-[acyl-carrier protein] synthase
MIVGIGVDQVDIRRIERLLKMYGGRFVKKVFTLTEQAYANESPFPVKAYANRFAAKEAASKALGTGIAGGIGWQDIEVLRSSSGAPSLCFYREARKKLLACLPSEYIPHTHLSVSDEPPYSIAFVIISGTLVSQEQGLGLPAK